MELVERLRTPLETRLPLDEFLACSKEEQSDIKDVGGFIGGYVRDGKRTASNIEYRQILALDVDHATDVDSIRLAGTSCVVYSTHKHRPDSPRLRLVMPLSRRCSPDEYEAVARQVAKSIGIDLFDDTTYQANRLMYWNAHPRGAECYFYESEGDPVDVDSALGLYPDWTDRSTWPTSSRVGVELKKKLDKQKDPLAKKGLVGAFCRAFTIREALGKWLSDIYIEEEGDRLTYAGGSSSKGVVIYDDKFIYSHHESDPCSGQLCNAWDMVRLHLFGELDARKSYEALANMAADVPEVKVELMEQRQQEALSAFDLIGVADEHLEESREWLRDLDMTGKGALASTYKNAALIIKNDERLRNIGAFNEFKQRPEIGGPLPWRPTAEKGQGWSDIDDTGLKAYLEQGYGYTSGGKVIETVAQIHDERKYHPVRDYLNGLKWDGVSRIDTLLIDYLGADDTLYIRAATRKTLVAAVARVMDPGCKFDYMLTLTGAQGLGKSTLLDKLGGDWYSDTLTSVSGKEGYEALHGVWVMEMAELTATRKAEIEAVKQFISKRKDNYRKAYARHSGEYPRQNIFIGTTNEEEFLRDPTGNRRYWTVKVGVQPVTKDLWSDFPRDQIWAEAVRKYLLGEELKLDKREEKELLEAQECHLESDPLEGVIYEYLTRPIPTNWNELTELERRSWAVTNGAGEVKRTTISAVEIWSELVGKSKEQMTKKDSRRINSVLGNMENWHPVQGLYTDLYGRQRGYIFKQKKGA